MLILLEREILLCVLLSNYQAIHMAGDSQAQATLFDLILEGSGRIVPFLKKIILPTSVLKSYPGTATGQQRSSWSTGLLEGYNL